ncbi:Crp/Fnr family transcriptional regulator [Limimaricola soesokkakensis]|uniref:Crp/Fnr family transcriptional regulator n=1 Tax=Limimaricola soesokkakensis TaxID=1343159 RepID=UPI0035594DF6
MEDLTGNRLLDGLPPSVLTELRPSLEAVELPLRSMLECRRQRITHVYFPATGIASVMVSGDGLPEAEAGMAGREGMTGTSLILEDDLGLHDVVMQFAGHGWRMTAGAFRSAMTIPAFRQRQLRFLQAQIAQTYATTLAFSHAKLELRLARWILMCCDRLLGKSLSVTHEAIALMLGVRRAGVTVALHELESRGFIRSTRCLIEVRDGVGLAASTEGYYGAPEAEYDRLLGADIRAW